MKSEPSPQEATHWTASKAWILPCANAGRRSSLRQAPQLPFSSFPELLRPLLSQLDHRGHHCSLTVYLFLSPQDHTRCYGPRVAVWTPPQHGRRSTGMAYLAQRRPSRISLANFKIFCAPKGFVPAYTQPSFLLYSVPSGALAPLIITSSVEIDLTPFPSATSTLIGSGIWYLVSGGVTSSLDTRHHCSWFPLSRWAEYPWRSRSTLRVLQPDCTLATGHVHQVVARPGRHPELLPYLPVHPQVELLRPAPSGRLISLLFDPIYLELEVKVELGISELFFANLEWNRLFPWPYLA